MLQQVDPPSAPLTQYHSENSPNEQCTEGCPEHCNLPSGGLDTDMHSTSHMQMDKATQGSMRDAGCIPHGADVVNQICVLHKTLGIALCLPWRTIVHQAMFVNTLA